LSNNNLATRLLSLPGFQRYYLPSVLQSVAKQFDALVSDVSKEDLSWNYLLQCASVFALSDDSSCLDAAYRIAQYTLTSEKTEKEQKAAAGIIMDRLTNSPSLDLAFERGYLDPGFEDHLPPTFQLEKISRGIRYSVLSKDAEIIPVNRFQADVYESARENDWVSISAPTSAGKSFILLKVITDFLRNNTRKTVIYLVPTRSLIQQVEYDIAESIAKQGITNVFVTAVPIIPEITKELKSELKTYGDFSDNLDEAINPPSLVFVLTQERYQLLLSHESNLEVDLLIIDEAQKIGDGARGVLLQHVIDETVRKSERTKVIFSSPMTSNPELLLKQAPHGVESRPIVSEHVAVNQNLIWVSQLPRNTRKWCMDLCVGDSTHRLGTFELPSRPINTSKRLSYVAFALGDERGGNLVYVNGPADAEKIALQLYELQGQSRETADSEIIDLVNLVKTVIHPNYALVNVLRRGIAFHYGNMPLLIKNELERLFKDGKIKYLVCTSTLIEGVNLPAKSIFVRTPKRGSRSPMNEIDFWNLAGRAGRQGKEFQGNVICIEPTEWEVEPPKKKVKFPIRPTLSNILLEDADELLEFIRNGTPRYEATKRPELEHAFVYFLSDYLRKGSFRGNIVLHNADDEFVAALEEYLKGIIEVIDIPNEVIFRNTGISPIAQQDLLNYFRSYPDDIENLIPAMPESVDAYESYVRIINRIGRHLSGDPEQLDHFHAILVLNWMKGRSLAYIIGKNWAYWRTKGKQLPTVIRETMQKIEEYARFKFVKFSSCYVDVLKAYFREVDREDLIDELPDMNIWLEFGASQETQISLMSVGLSRTSAIAISELIVVDEMKVPECLEWLASLNLTGLDLSPIIISEIEAVLKRHGYIVA
jgi:hypothetical protein